MGFFEILLISVITLLVVGPQRMPEAVRNVALTIGRIKRTFNSACTEIEREIGADDIRRQLHNEEVMHKLGKLNSGLSEIDQKIYDGKLAMPWTEDEYLDAQEQKKQEQNKSTDSDPPNCQHKNKNREIDTINDAVDKGNASTNEGASDQAKAESAP